MINEEFMMNGITMTDECGECDEYNELKERSDVHTYICDLIWVISIELDFFFFSDSQLKLDRPTNRKTEVRWHNLLKEMIFQRSDIIT